ncbi:MAG: putative porin [Oleispira sp.]|jgi:predicted porin
MEIIMKKTALSLAIAAVLPAFANAEKVEIEVPEFYGKINVSVQNTQEGSASISELVSNASRLGVKGNIDLNHGLQGVYKAEYETQVDDGDKGGQTFSQRNIYAGIKGGFGQVIVGMFDTPLKKAQKKIDLFNDLEGDIKSVISKSDNREANSVQYNTPTMSGLVATIAHIASEDEAINDGTSSSLTFSRNALYAAVAYDTDVEADGINVTRLVAQYSIAGITLGGLWETQRQNGDNNDGWVYSAAYKLTSDVKLKAQYGESDIVKDNAETYSLGVDYKLAEGAKVYAFATDEEFGDDSSNEYYGVGLEYKF